MMLCKKIKYQLPDFITNRLSVGESQQISEHLQKCLICKGELASIEVTFKKVDTEYIAEPSSTYWNNLLPRIHNRIEESTKPKYTDWILRTSIPAMATVAAIFLVIKVFFFDDATIEQQPNLNDNIKSFILSLNENEITYLEMRYANLNDHLFENNIDSNTIINYLDTTALSGSNGYIYQSLHSLDEKEIDDLLAILETSE